jgi:hypothetical protein
MQEDGIIFTIGDIPAEVVDSVGNIILRQVSRATEPDASLPSFPACSLQVKVEPSQQNLIRSQSQKILDSLSILTEPIQLGMYLDVNLCQ